jgi:hypothetical protein
MSIFMRINDPSDKSEKYMFHCPGCEYAHSVRVNSKLSPSWQWNGSVDKPTISPSVLVTTPGMTGNRCHSFIRDGKIQFLNDCDHKLAGKTVDIPDWDD